MKKKLIAYIILCIWFLGIVNFTNAQVYINEYLSSNSSVNADPEFNDYSDWIELYNSSNQIIDLGGYYLTDNLKDPTKWRIPDNTTIGAKGYLVVYTDGKDTALHTNYKLLRDGEEIGLFSPYYNLIDSVVYSFEKPDISHGRATDGANTWAYFPAPTPGFSNNTSTPFTHLTDNVPQFSVKGGFFDSPIAVELSTYLGGNIRYTIDGSEPTWESALYHYPIQMNTTTVLRARVFKPNSYPGDVVTSTYFFNEHFMETGLPVFSLVTDPDNFWSADSGIYVQRFKPEWEVPVNVELFENNGSDRAAFNLPAGTKVNGLNSWQLPQKMLGIYFRKRYGSGKLEYPLFFDRHRNSFKSFALRASGSDWSYTLFRDGMAQGITQYNMDVDILGFRPSVVYLNGEYLGIHNIRSKVDEDYIASNYHLNSDSFDIVENEDYAEAGSLDQYSILENALSEDLSIETNFENVGQLMDIENFTDYVISEIVVRNSSINHNVFAWKPKNNGKWRWILVDLDRGFFSPEDYPISYYVGRTVWPLSKLLSNDGYEHYFGKRLADHLFTTFNTERINGVIDEYKNAIYREIPYHLERWKGASSSYGDAIESFAKWEANVENLKSFAAERPSYLLDELKNFGFEDPVSLTISSTPRNGGNILFNGLNMPMSPCIGAYPQNETIVLEAQAKPGFTFSGWAGNGEEIIISKGDVWKYIDNGTSPGTNWAEPAFNDANWKKGNGKFGYGDNNENTTLDYGGDSNNKYITTYFRKKFTVSESKVNYTSLTVNLLYDDGAIIYLNGQQVLSENMPVSGVDNQTLALSAVSDEDLYRSFSLGADLLNIGENIIAVEIHQRSASSSDLGFDLSMSISVSGNIISYDPVFSVQTASASVYTALFEQSSSCFVPDTIYDNVTLDMDCSPYFVNNDIVINPGAILTIDPGVEIYMMPGQNIFVHGKMNALGSENSDVRFKIHPDFAGENWGAVCLLNSIDTSVFKHVIIEDASQGPQPIREMAAISAFHANVILDYVTITNVASNPVAARYSSVWMTNSMLHSKVTGDLINVKYGYGYIRNCDFRGNDKPDTDAIDYDDVENGVISNCRIYDFFGFNSDAIDIGEKATNISIDSVLIYTITDKGVSVGQQSSATLSNSTILNCNLGMGLKDSCKVNVENCTFYGNRIPVSCYEKNIGRAGGNAWIQNTILSNSAQNSYFADNRSYLDISYSLSDNDSLYEGQNNVYGDPMFGSPGQWNFELKNGSPALSSGNVTDMGTPYFLQADIAAPVISGIFYNVFNEPRKTEFITVANPSDVEIDVSGYTFTDGIVFTFPEGTILPPGKEILVAKYNDIRLISDNTMFFKWMDGNLSNEGENIQLENKYGILVDYVNYDNKGTWPEIFTRMDDGVLRLNSLYLDNHFGKNWTVEKYETLVGVENETIAPKISVYPNPAHDLIHVRTNQTENIPVEIYSVTGKLLLKVYPQENLSTIYLKSIESNILIVKYGSFVVKVMRY